MVNSMLFYSGLSEGFWGEAMLTACYLLNKAPNKNNKITPYELWYKKQPNLSYLRVWGYWAVVRLSEPKKKNLGEKVIESRDAIFDENRFSSIPRPKDIVSSSNGTQGGDLLGETPIEIHEPRRKEDPKTFDEAMKSRDVDDEIGSIMENNTGVLSDLPPGCKPLGCKWIFKRKMKVDGTIDVGIVNSQRVLQLPRQSI
ncbi:zinc finger, CCHC-type containing protein [Tanacetum coccineum]